MTEAAADIVLPLPPNAPRVKRNVFARWLGRAVLRAGGWRMDDRQPTDSWHFGKPLDD